MTALVLRGLLERRLRSALTAIAVLLGVAMIAGTYVLTDQIRDAFADISETAQKGRDAVLTAKTEFTSSFSTQVEQLPESLVARIAKLPEVELAEGEAQAFGSLVVDGELLSNRGQPGLVFSQARSERISATEPVEGRAPSRPGEIAVSADMAREKGIEVGDRLQLATAVGLRPVTVVGLVEFGGEGSAAGFGFTIITLDDLQRWFDREGEVTEIAVVAAGEITPEQLVQRLKQIVPDGVEVRTATQTASEEAEEVTGQINSFLGPALLAFAGAALLVGAFIIFNTFSISVAERTREFAALRTIGATRSQVLGSIAAEALAIGLVASLLGLLAGLGFAKLVAALFDAAGTSVPTAGLVLLPRTIAVALGVGIVVTLLSSLIPAARATRVPPALAMQEGMRLPRSRLSRLAPYVAALIGVGGAVLLFVGLFGGGPATGRLLSIAVGAVLIFVGVALIARYLVRPVAGVVGFPLERAFAVVGRLARENAQRNPGRTAITAAALMVGLGLVVFVAVFTSGVRASISDSFGRLVRAQLYVSTDTGFEPVPAEAERLVAGVPGVESTAGLLYDQVKVDGRSANALYDYLLATDLARLGEAYDFEWLDGSDTVLSEMKVGDVLIEEQFAEGHRLGVGDRYEIQTPSGGTEKLTVVGEYRDPQILQGTIGNLRTLAAVSPARDPVGIFVNLAPGADVASVKADIERALERFPVAKVRDQEQTREWIEDQTDQIVYLLYALLAMSVVISLFGIANSLFLSIHERTREFGLLRAVGVTRSQVRRMIRYESVITAAIGGLLGTVIGLFFAWVVTLSLDELGLAFDVPLRQLVIFLVLAVIVGIVGAVLPARRGARLDVLRALEYE